MQGGSGNGQVPGVPGAAARAHGAAVRSLVLHGVRSGAAVEGCVGGVSSLPGAAAAGSGEAVRAGVPGVDEDSAGARARSVAAAVGVAAGGDGRRDRDVPGGDGSGR